mgnify:CR=1 FL=1
MVVFDPLDTLLLADVEVPVKVIADELTGIRYGALEYKLRKGLSIELPLKLAVPLWQKGEVELDVNKLPDFSELNKIRWKEERARELQRLERGFYVKVELLLAYLKASAEDNREKEQVLRRSKAAIVDIIRARMKKIVELAVANPKPEREIMKKMSVEERMLYVALCSVLNDWYTFMVSRLERGEELWRP